MLPDRAAALLVLAAVLHAASAAGGYGNSVGTPRRAYHAPASVDIVTIAPCYGPRCQARCGSDKDCPSGQRCIYDAAAQISRCQDSCDGKSCGKNAHCSIDADGSANCVCPVDFTGDPDVGCREELKICSFDFHCDDRQVCARVNSRLRICQDGCVHSGLPCSQRCITRDHRPQCYCSGADSSRGPVDRNGCAVCKKDSDCLASQLCFRDGDSSFCQDACEAAYILNPFYCNATAESCKSKNHRAVCECEKPGLCGSSRASEEPAEALTPCYSDRDCYDDESCSQVGGLEFCFNTCQTGLHRCHPSAECRALDHNATCNCPQFTVPVPAGVPCPSDTQYCKSDRDCPDYSACSGEGICSDACELSRRCGPNSFCVAGDHKTSCQCAFGYTEENGLCVRAKFCEGASGCRAPEVCEPGHYGYSRCKAKKHYVCTEDKDCNDTSRCYHGRCVDVCQFNRPCGESAFCQAANHRPSCVCNYGFAGNPYQKCTKTEICPCERHEVCVNDIYADIVNCRSRCATSLDCKPDESCVEEPIIGVKHCEDTCIAFDLRCAKNATCRGSNHQAVCTCKPGYVGDPYTKCLPNGDCVTDDDCPNHRVCFNPPKSPAKCINACARVNCPINAVCLAKDHKPRCQCYDDYILNQAGDMCLPAEPQPMIVKSSAPVNFADKPTARKCPPRQRGIGDFGVPSLFHGWVDVQGTGCKNDYCRFASIPRVRLLSCALAGGSGGEYGYNSTYFVELNGHDGWSAMVDVNKDGKDDFCRCLKDRRGLFRLVCMYAMERGFTGSEWAVGSQFMEPGFVSPQPSCHSVKVQFRTFSAVGV